MDDERIDSTGTEAYTDSSDHQEQSGEYGVSAENGTESFSEASDRQLPEDVGLSELKEAVSGMDQPALRLVDTDAAEVDKKRMKRRKKIERRKKRKERRRKIRKVLLILLVIGVFAGIASWLFFSSAIFAVSEITVNHNTLKSDKYIILESGIQAGENIFQFKRSDAEKEILKQNPYISDVSISRKLPNRVIITVTEHTPTAAVKYEGQYLILDKNGRVAGVEKTQLTATRLTGVEVKQYTQGKVPVVQNSSVLKQSLKLINKVNASGMFFKKLDVSSSMIVHGYITDDLECTGEAEDLIENLEGIKAIVYDLSQKKTMKGTIYVGDDGYATFSPASSKNTVTAAGNSDSDTKAEDSETGKKKDSDSSSSSGSSETGSSSSGSTTSAGSTGSGKSSNNSTSSGSSGTGSSSSGSTTSTGSTGSGKSSNSSSSSGSSGTGSSSSGSTTSAGST